MERRGRWNLVNVSFKHLKLAHCFVHPTTRFIPMAVGADDELDFEDESMDLKNIEAQAPPGCKCKLCVETRCAMKAASKKETATKRLKKRAGKRLEKRRLIRYGDYEKVFRCKMGSTPPTLKQASEKLRDKKYRLCFKELLGVLQNTSPHSNRIHRFVFMFGFCRNKTAMNVGDLFTSKSIPPTLVIGRFLEMKSWWATERKEVHLYNKGKLAVFQGNVSARSIQAAANCILKVIGFKIERENKAFTLKPLSEFTLPILQLRFPEVCYLQCAIPIFIPIIYLFLGSAVSSPRGCIAQDPRVGFRPVL
jgi:hypothetical protein